jgi:2-keto-4-pentenoate hydratase
MITLNHQQIEQEAHLLYLAERNRNQMSATTVRYPNMTIDDGNCQTNDTANAPI